MRQAVAGAKARVAWRGLVAVVLAAAGCQGARTQAPPPQAPPPPEEEARPAVSAAGDRPAGEPAAPAPPRSDEPDVRAQLPKPAEQVAPPLDVKTPPADAIRTPSGLIYKKLVANAGGAGIKRNDTVMIRYTGWRQSTGETFYSNRSGQPMPLALSAAAPGYVEAMQLLRQGEKAMLWMPPALGTRAGQPVPPDAETLVYEIEVVDIQRAPEVPADLKAPRAARALKSGTRYVVLKRGTGTAKARSFDTVTYHLTSWDSEGRQLESTEVRQKPTTTQPFLRPRALEEVLTSIPVEQRVRFWLDGEKALAGRDVPETRPKGLLTFELELLQIDKAATAPPPAPPDVKKPPAGAKKTERGTFYKVLKAGQGGPRPGPTDTVVVHYTGWTTDGRMFDSSIVRGEPAEFPLDAVIPGWSDGLQVMSVGDRARLWIPEELAYQGVPNRPAGMLVFDIELLEIKAAASPPPPPPPPPSPPPHTVAPNILEGYRIRGDKNIVPDDSTKIEIQRAAGAGADTRLVGSFKLCIDTQGLVASVTRLKSTGYAAYDEKILREMRQWGYRPFQIDQKPVPVCTAVTFIYTQRDPPPPAR